METQFFRFTFFLFICLTLPVIATAQVIDIPEPIPPPSEVRHGFDLDPFYQQWVDVEGLPVVASAKVNPYALKEAAWQIRHMIGHRPDVLQALVPPKMRFTVIGYTELLTDIPEYSDHQPDFLTFRIRGLGGSGLSGYPAASTSEENVLHYPGINSSYNILIHEFAHVIHRFGLKIVDPTFDGRLEIAYNAAMAKGLWQGTYAAADRKEYWAEGTQAWFNPKGGGSFDNYGNTRQALKAYDPGLTALLAEIYGDTEWRYTSPAVRTHLPHLQGFDPQDSPTYQGWPELEALYRQFGDPNSDGGDNWVDLRPYDPSLLPNLNSSRTDSNRTMTAFVNVTQAHVSVYWVARDGRKGFWTRVRPGRVRWHPSYPNNRWLIKDANGKDLAVFQSVKGTGRALITPTLNFITPGLSKVSGDNQSGISGTVLSNPFVVEARDETLSALEGISVTFTITAGDGTLSVEHTKTDWNGRAESTLTLGPNLGTNTVSVSAAGIEGAETFNAVAEAPVDIPDANLRAAIEAALDKAPGTPITPAEMRTLTRLVERNANISNLTGLESATNLTTLDLDENNITDLSPVVGLTNLTWLLIGGNNISDISVLGGLTNLRGLSLYNNNISDISAVTELTALTHLWLGGNNISDLSPLVANTGLGSGDRVDVSENPLNRVSIKTHIPELQSRGVTVEFDNIIIESVNIPDPNLRAAIEKALRKAAGAPITTTDMAKLTRLEARDANIRDLTGLESATNLTRLDLGGHFVDGEYVNSNTISDLLPLTGLTNLTALNLWGNTISDISAVAGLTRLTELYLGVNNISNISVVADLTNLRYLGLEGNNILDISTVVGLTNLTWLNLGANSILDVSVVANLANLTWLNLGGNKVSDVSALAGLTQLNTLYLWASSITDLSPLVENAGLGEGDTVDVRGNPLNYASIYTHIPELQSRGVTVEFDTRKVQRLLKISGDNQQGTVGAMLTEPFVVEVRDRNGAVFAGVPVTFAVTVGGGTLSVTSTTTDENGRVQSTLMLGTNRGTNDVAVSAAGTKVQVIFNAISNPLTTEYLWSIPAGISLIHVPLKVTAVDGVDQPIESISDLYTALGGVTAVNFLMTYDPQVQEWRSYFGVSDRGTPADRALTDDTGIIAGMKAPVSLRLSGTALGTNGNSTIILNPGLNLVGIPLRDERINRVSDLLRLNGIGGNVPVVTLSDGGEFKVVGRAGDPGDIAITGGGAFILNARQTATVAISGEAWTNVSETAAAPLVTPKSIKVGDTTPVLGLRGAIVDEKADLNTLDFRVTVKNLSSGRTVTGMTKDKGTGYQLTVVDIETARAATIGDILEISAQSPNPFIGVQSLRYTVTAKDVRQSRIQLPGLVAYEIPAETELLANYPNPFNPETWIPYRLAEDAFVTLIIYDGSGRVVRTLDIGHRIASAYENRSKAIYWDGRNRFGESVASGVYFYHLSAGDYSATRKMLILK